MCREPFATPLQMLHDAPVALRYTLAEALPKTSDA
jgi:hypothetical protein